MNLGLFLGKTFTEGREVAQSVFVNQQPAECIAYAYSSALGIGDDALAHLQIAILVEVTVYHAGSGLYNRYFGSITHEAAALLSPPRDTEVAIPHCIQHFAGSLMGGR